eukprot:670436-Pelagomonas_calceolata.AAC.4
MMHPRPQKTHLEPSDLVDRSVHIGALALPGVEDSVDGVPRGQGSAEPHNHRHHHMMYTLSSTNTACFLTNVDYHKRAIVEALFLPACPCHHIPQLLIWVLGEDLACLQVHLRVRRQGSCDACALEDASTVLLRQGLMNVPALPTECRTCL